jgi:hypothetical protein
MLIAGIGTRNTVIVGSLAKSHELFDQVVQYPALGYRVIGCVAVGRGAAQRSDVKNLKILGKLQDLPELIHKQNVREVLIALDSSDHDRLLEIMAECNSHNVSMKIMPDLYDIISGQARTNAIYGFPLIEISPQLMSPWEENMKRLIDLLVSLLVLILGMPVWILIAILVKLESAGWPRRRTVQHYQVPLDAGRCRKSWSTMGKQERPSRHSHRQVVKETSPG